ncbi:MAG: formyltransferase family protein, partial [Hydrogenophaga sp.]
MAAIVEASRRDGWKDKHNAEVVAVFGNKVEAQGLVRADQMGLATGALDHKAFAFRDSFDAAMMAQIDRFEPALVVLAGFMRILTPSFVEHYAGRLINIHPSLLPAFAGLNTHQRAINAGCKFAGCT